jgi:predicted DNA-binding protein with PD1-like motif
MRSKLLHQAAERTYAIVLDSGDEALGCLTQFAREQRLSAARFSGLGAFSDVVFGFFDLERKDYLRLQIDEQVEVASLIGDVALASGEPRLHAHIVVTKRDGSAWGGHLLEGHVRPTLEVLLIESPAYLRREHDPGTGLPLIAL